MPETLVAHCGGCVREMVLEEERPPDAEVGHGPLVRFVCRHCGFESPWRASLKDAADDVVWATLKQSRAARRSRQVDRETGRHGVG